ncbi:pili retraction protein pilT [Clostridium tetanomorphum]|nr:pili retraction protein pilT [Clostridium tetanomorphum]
MIELNTLLETTIKEKASDLHLTVGISPTIRVNGQLTNISSEKLTPIDTEKYARKILGDLYEEYCSKGEMDTSFLYRDLGDLE